MEDLDSIMKDPRVTLRRSGEPAPNGRCVVYWMQRSQRAVANPALNVAIEVGNLLGKPVVAYFQLLPRAPRANLRHYEFMEVFSKTLGDALDRPSWASVPPSVLAILVGEMAEMLLNGQRAVPEAASKLGYNFKYPHLAGALKSLKL